MLLIGVLMRKWSSSACTTVFQDNPAFRWHWVDCCTATDAQYATHTHSHIDDQHACSKHKPLISGLQLLWAGRKHRNKAKPEIKSVAKSLRNPLVARLIDYNDELGNFGFIVPIHQVFNNMTYYYRRNILHSLTTLANIFIQSDFWKVVVIKWTGFSN